MSGLAWTGAIGGAVAAVAGIIAAIGAWRGEVVARWQARVESLRNDEARRENELHRMRHAQLYHWWADMQAGPARRRAMAWFAEWTGAREPYRADVPGSLPPGFGSADVDDAYQGYIGLLDAVFHPGQPGAPPRPLTTPDVPEAITGDDAEVVAP
jgi:hypothetical protein